MSRIEVPPQGVAFWLENIYNTSEIMCLLSYLKELKQIIEENFRFREATECINENLDNIIHTCPTILMNDRTMFEVIKYLRQLLEVNYL